MAILNFFLKDPSAATRALRNTAGTISACTQPASRSRLRCLLPQHRRPGMKDSPLRG